MIFWILQVVWHCRRWASDPRTARLVLSFNNLLVKFLSLSSFMRLSEFPVMTWHYLIVNINLFYPNLFLTYVSWDLKFFLDFKIFPWGTKELFCTNFFLTEFVLYSKLTLCSYFFTQNFEQKMGSQTLFLWLNTFLDLKFYWVEKFEVQ